MCIMLPPRGKGRHWGVEGRGGAWRGVEGFGEAGTRDGLRYKSTKISSRVSVCTLKGF